MRKIFYIETLKTWINYFKIVHLRNIIANFVMPLIVILLIMYFNDKTYNNNVYRTFLGSVITASSLIVGFSYSTYLSIISSNSINIQKLKEKEMNNKKMSLYEALLTKMNFVIINVIFSLMCSLIILLFEFYNRLVVLLILYVLIASILVILEIQTNIHQIFRKNI